MCGIGDGLTETLIGQISPWSCQVQSWSCNLSSSTSILSHTLTVLVSTLLSGNAMQIKKFTCHTN